MNIKEKFKNILKKEGIAPNEFSEKIDLTYDSYKSLMSRKIIPRWVKSFMLGYNLKKAKDIEVIDPEIVKK